ncbi:MAG: isopentenyl-diphosphate Delta-isomerase [Verrucomicrobia bacterium]|nr:isopentenyl-diphosphate Delta-isomerase [Verrucomicrobiota bacterium]
MTEHLILVNTQNRAIGQGEKRAVHEAGLLHRAFSVFLTDDDGRILLQQRSRKKYHSGGLWANSCCGHPRPGETTRHAAERRLGEELGATTKLRFGFKTHYRAEFTNGLAENEIVYVYFGALPAKLRLNPAEVASVTLRTLTELKTDAAQHPEKYVFWLNHYLTQHDREIRAGLKAARRTTSRRH